MGEDYDEKYTNPELRRKLKAELEASDKGGRVGEWSARKSQLLAQEYERQGGDYIGDKDERQKSLETWTDENWQTMEGDANARKDDTTERYLPKEVWDRLSQKERKKALKAKERASAQGEQYAAWTPAVKDAMHEMQSEHDEPTKKELYDEAKKLDVDGRSTMSKDELADAVEEAK